MIFTCPICCEITAPENAVRRNPIPDLKKNWLRISTATEKKHRSDLNTRPRDLFLIACLNRSTQEKDFPNTDACRWRNTTEIDVEIRALVTTSHVFWSPHPRTVALSLPISLRNLDFVDDKSSRNARPPGGEVSWMQPTKPSNR